MMITAIVDGFESKSTRLGNAPNFAVRRAYLQQRATYENLGAMAAETLPSIKAVLEALAYSAFLFVIPLAVLPFGWRFLASWLQVLVWLQMWAPLYAILNYIMTMAARAKSMAALSVSNVDGITIANSVGLVNVNADIAAMTGYLALSIPFLCIAMVKGLSSFASMASQLTQVTQGAGAHAIQDALSGNYSFGNIGMSGRQIANTQMLNHSYGASIRSGSFQRSDGQMDVITSSDGQQIVNIANSQLPIHLNVAQSLSAQKLKQSSKLYQNGLMQTESYYESVNDLVKYTTELSTHLSKNKNLNQKTTQGTIVDDTKGMNKTGQSMTDASQTNNIGESRKANTSVSVNPLGPVNTLLKAVGANLSGVLSGSAQKNETASKTDKSINLEDFQEASRRIEQVAQDKSFSTLDDEGKKIIENIHRAWDKAQVFKKEATKNFRKAHDYQAQASQIESLSSTINANYDTKFFEWLKNQKAANVHGGHIGEKEAIRLIFNEPNLAFLHAQRFLLEQGLVPEKPKEIPDDPNIIKTEYEHEKAHMIVAVDEQEAFKKMEALRAQAKEGGLMPVDDQGLIEQFKPKEQNAQAKIANQEKLIQQKHQADLKKHGAKSRTSLPAMALKQEVLHVKDVGTQGWDLMSNVFKEGSKNIDEHNKHQDEKDK